MVDPNVPLNPGPAAGLAAGGYFLAIHTAPVKQTRCSARVAYYHQITQDLIYL